MLSNEITRQIDELKADNRSGASELVKKAINIYQEQLRYIEDENKDIHKLIIDISRSVIAARPSMAPLINTVGFLIHNLDTITKKNMLIKLKDYELMNNKKFKQVENAFQSFIQDFKKKPLSILLISYSSTIIELLLASSGLDIKFYVLESRPLLEGHKTTERLSEKFDSHLIIDAAMGKIIKKVDLVLLGVDSVLRDGSIVNKIGSYPLACIARANKKGVYAVCDSFKYNLNSHFDKPILIEKKPPSEITTTLSQSSRISIHNYYFDITPQRYLSGIVSNYGNTSIKKFLKLIQKNLPLDWYNAFL